MARGQKTGGRQRRAGPWLGQYDSGVYCVNWYDAGAKRTKQRSLGTSDSVEAQIAFGQFLLNGREVYAPEIDAELSVSVCLDQYIREHAMVRCADPGRQIDASKHLKEFFEHTFVGDVDIPLSRAYANTRYEGGVGGGERRKDKRGSPSTVRRELVVLGAAANHAVKWKRLSRDQLPSIELPAESTKETLWFEKNEIRQLIDTAEGLLKAFIKIAYFTAGRKMSVQSLTVGQIDFEARRINLDKPGAIQTKKRRPIVPLYEEIEDDIRALADKSEDGRLFGRMDFYRPFKQHCRDLQFGNRSNPHMLRHSRATHLLQRGTSIYDVANLLGDTVKTVERVYGHHSSEYLAATTGGY